MRGKPAVLKTCGQPYPAVLPPADREAAHCLDKCRLASVHGSLSVLGCLFRVPFGGTKGDMKTGHIRPVMLRPETTTIHSNIQKHENGLSENQGTARSVK